VDARGRNSCKRGAATECDEVPAIAAGDYLTLTSVSHSLWEKNCSAFLSLLSSDGVGIDVGG
jgi:hypothetical protein